MKNIQKGFTLIELMIVVAIIAILAAIAIPAYQNYLIRAQVAEAATLTDGAKTAASEFYANTGHFPLSNASAGLPTSAKSISGKYVSGVSLATVGMIQATMNGTKANSVLKDEVFALSAIANGGSIDWSCTNAATTIDAKYLPSSCRK